MECPDRKKPCISYETVGSYILRADQLSMAKRMTERVLGYKSAILQAPAGFGKSIVIGSVIKRVMDECIEQVLTIVAFSSKKLGVENYSMFGIPPNRKIMDKKDVSLYPKHGSILTQHIFGITITTLSAIIQDPNDDDEDNNECDKYNASRTMLVKMLNRLPRVRTVIIQCDECHQLTSQNTKKTCMNIDRLRNHLAEKNVTFYVMGNSATPSASGSLYSKRGMVRTNMLALYGVDPGLIVVDHTEHEKNLSTVSRWQNSPGNLDFKETFNLSIEGTDLTGIHDYLLHRNLFSSPESDDMKVECINWEVWEECKKDSPLPDTYKLLENHPVMFELLILAESRRVRRKTRKDILFLTPTEAESYVWEGSKGHDDFENKYVEIGGKMYTASKTYIWKAKNMQVAIRSKLSTMINKIEIHAFNDRKFTGDVRGLTSLTKIKDLQIVHDVVGEYGVNYCNAPSNTGGALIAYIPNRGANSEMVKHIEKNKMEENFEEWYNLTNKDHNEVDRDIQDMLTRGKDPSVNKLQIGLISHAHTVGTNIFGKNVQGILVIGGCMDDTRRQHLSGRIVRPVPPSKGDVFALKPILEHSRNKLLHDIQLCAEGRNTTPIIVSDQYTSLHETVKLKYKDDEKAFLSLFDPETGEPFQIVKNRDICKELVDAFEERKGYNLRFKNRPDDIERKKDPHFKKLMKLLGVVWQNE